MRRRLDVELVRRGLVESRTRAQQAIDAGRVLVSGARAERAGRLVEAAEPIHIEGPPDRFVSRGGEKLDAALERFGVTVAGRRCLDAGASTGGFTDCLLQRGAAEVVAVDVGSGQLAWSLRNDPRVKVVERFNVRHLDAETVGGPVDVAVADLSFISLALVAPALVAAIRPGGEAVLLVKPQFEAGRRHVGRGGIVSDPAVHRDVLERVRDSLATSGLTMVGVMPSPIRGASGNIEFLGHFVTGAGDPVGGDDLAVAVAAGPRGGGVTAVGIVAHRGRGRAVAERAVSWLEAAGAEVRVPAPDAAALGLERHATDPDKFASGLGLTLSLGGDGTMLRAVDLVAAEGVPVLGVNVGQLGFLTEIEPDQLEAGLEKLMAGDYQISERMVLRVDVRSSGPAAGTWLALNEAVLEKVSSGHLVRLGVSINGKFFTTYAADGLIVATPTGSTAYNFSARGPIVSPSHRCLVLTPVSPHMLFDHSLVFGPDEQLAFEVTGSPPVGLILDGREVGRLAEGDTVHCTQGPRPARLVTFAPRDFHQVLKAKFGLADR
ncbi:MAG TPA: TlyA family rRNA (cytidine-2'-O)-methyltransferase [Acidimicrobiia bacterium]|nr:TlyA family rRNA (cytidine-2'-O)-methyltransferase [Acidimicrobiia bacterium]